ncbi:MAG TPA: MBL fold metallo-hydrolase [Propionibacteriaceae bacterium]|nr:MBL fold metallo-hydrolase [Propionibacteriaceae bacterium]
MADLRLTRLVVGGMENNCWFLHPADGSPGLLIDAAAVPERILAELGGRGLATVVTTHRHHDHIAALAEVVAATGAVACSGTPDADAIAEATGVPQLPLWTGDEVVVGHDRLGVIGMVGHTPGSVTLVWTPSVGPVHLFTGDALFPGGVGNTSTPADFASLFRDVTGQLFGRFEDDTVVHPGHGRDTTLGAERPHLDEWLARGW